MKYTVTESYIYEVEADTAEEAETIFQEWAEAGMVEDATTPIFLGNQTDTTETLERGNK